MKRKIGNAVFFALMAFWIALGTYGIVCRAQNRPLNLFGYQLYVIRSGSMKPELHPYDVAFVKYVDVSTLAVGDVVTFRRSDGLIVTHRIVRVTDSGFVTRGDANSYDDNPITAAQIFGKNVGKARYLGYIVACIQSPLGVSVLLVILLAVLFHDKIKALFTKGDKHDPPARSPL